MARPKRLSEGTTAVEAGNEEIEVGSKEIEAGNKEIDAGNKQIVVLLVVILQEQTPRAQTFLFNLLEFQELRAINAETK